MTALQTKPPNIAEVVEAARQDPGIFTALVMEGFPVGQIHREWLAACLKHDRLLIVAAREHAKTTVISIAYTAWRIGKNPNLRIKIFSSSNDNASSIADAIESILKSQIYKAVFPHIEIVSKDGAASTGRKYTVVRTKKWRDPSIACFGASGTPEGGRGDLIILDDLFAYKTSQSPRLRKKIKEYYYNAIVNMATKDSQIIHVGTIWHEDDLLSEINREQDSDYIKMYYAIDENFNPIWPEYWTVEMLKKRCREIGEVFFNAGFRHIPLGGGTLITREIFEACQLSTIRIGDMYEMADRKRKAGEWQIIVSHDPCGENVDGKTLFKKPRTTPNNRKSFAGIIVAGISRNGIRYPIDMYRYKGHEGQSVSAQTLRIFNKINERLSPELFVVETNLQGGSLNWAEELKVKLPIKGIHTSDETKWSPTAGVYSVATKFENKMWQIPIWDHTACDCAWCSWRQELTSYPHSLRDDMVMTTWLLDEAVRRYLKIGSGMGFAVWKIA